MTKKQAHIIHLTVTDSNPLMSRYVAISPQTTAAQLALIIDAAFDFRCPMLGTFDTERGEFKPNQLANVNALDTLWMAAERITYTAADTYWQVEVQPLSPTLVSQDLPALIDHSGPDAFPGFVCPCGMTNALEELRKIEAGLTPEPGMEATLAHHFPNLSNHQIRLALTQTYAPLIVERMTWSLRTYDVSVDDMPPLVVAPESGVPEREGQSSAATPARRAHLSVVEPSTTPEHCEPDARIDIDLEALPRLSQESAVFIGDKLVAVLNGLAETGKLTHKGNLTAKDILQLLSHTGNSTKYVHNGTPRQSSIPGLSALMDWLERGLLIRVLDSSYYPWLLLTPAAHELKKDPARLARHMLPFLAQVLHTSSIEGLIRTLEAACMFWDYAEDTARRHRYDMDTLHDLCYFFDFFDEDAEFLHEEDPSLPHQEPWEIPDYLIEPAQQLMGELAYNLAIGVNA